MDNEEIDLLRFIMDCSFTRGAFIHDTIQTERCIDEFICRHFCSNNDRKIELIEAIMATKRITYDSKIDVFKFIMERHYSDWVRNYPDFNKDLRKIGEYRNIFAHYLLDTSKESINELKGTKGIAFIKFDRDTHRIVMSEETLMQHDSLVKKYGEAIAQLIAQDYP